MRLARASHLLLLVGSLSIAAPESPAIRFPAPAVVADPPTPAPAPNAIAKLTGETLYVVEADTPVLLLASPQGLVTITEDTGPLKIRGKFIDGNGKTETRTFKGKQVFIIEAAASGRVELLVIPQTATKASDVIRKTIDVEAGQAPQPPPAPKPPTPDPMPKPGPLADVAWVVTVRETADQTPAIGKLLADPWWTALKAKGIGFKHYEQNDPAIKDKHYLDYQSQAGGLPFYLLLDKTGKVLDAKKLPASVTDIDAQIKGK